MLVHGVNAVKSQPALPFSRPSFSVAKKESSLALGTSGNSDKKKKIIV